MERDGKVAAGGGESSQITAWIMLDEDLLFENRGEAEILDLMNGIKPISLTAGGLPCKPK